MEHTLSDGTTVEILARKELSVRRLRQVWRYGTPAEKARQRLKELGIDPSKPDDPEEVRRYEEGLSEDEKMAVQDLSCAIAAAHTASWSRAEPISFESILDLPEYLFNELTTLCLDAWSEGKDFSGEARGDPKALSDRSASSEAG